MRHGKRRKLSAKDFNKALKWSDVEPIYGFHNTETPAFHFCKEGEIHYMEEKEVNLLELALNSPTFEPPGSAYLKVQWLAVEGVHRMNISTQIPTGKKNGQVTVSTKEELMNYYNQITKAILGNDEELMKIALEDLRTNSKIAPLLPYLVNFVSVGVKKVSHDLTQLTKLLYTVHALVCNQSLYLGPSPYLNLLVQGLLYCILEPLAASINPVNDHWALRDYASRLLAQLVRIWTTQVNCLYDNCIESLKEVFTDFSKPFCSHYGAVIAIIALGPQAVQLHLLPHITSYWPHLSFVIDDSTCSNVQARSDAQKVHGSLLLAALLTLEHESNQFMMMQVSDPDQVILEGVQANLESLSSQLAEQRNVEEFSLPVKREKMAINYSSFEAYRSLYECFGDSLAGRLREISISRYYKSASQPVVQLFSCPELLQSGEELLEAFNVKDDEWQSVSADDDHSYDDHDDNSLISDDGEVETESVPTNVDLRIKSTVSDPTLGIKLTIAKLPRSSSTSSNNEYSGRPAKRKKLSIKIKKEQIEKPESTPPFTSMAPVKDRNVSIEFSFAGASPICKSRLKRNIIIPTYETFMPSEYHTASLKLKRIGKVNRSALKQTWSRKLRTCSLLSVL